MVRTLFRKVIAPVFERVLGGDRLTTFILMLVNTRLARLSSKEGLRFLFNVENNLYPLEGRLAVEYGEGLHTKHRHMKYHDFFSDRVGESDAVLDVGCGNGAVAHTVATRTGASVLGVDLSSDNIALAESRNDAPNVSYIVGDVLKVIPSGEYNVIILSNVLEHLPDRAHFLKNLTKTTGAKRLLIRVPLFERDWRVPLKKEIGVEWRLDTTHETEYVIEEFFSEVEEAGLRIVHHECRWGEIWSELVRADDVRLSA